MDIADKLQALKLTETAFDREEDYYFLDWCKKGSGGRLIFAEHVVPFLSLEDLTSAAVSCRQMNAMCRTYTIGEVLEKYDLKLSITHKMDLGKLVMCSVSPIYESMQPIRRLVRTSEDTHWARLYHPCQVPEIYMAMCAYCKMHGIDFDGKLLAEFDWDANQDKGTRVLVKALFGESLLGWMDVTIIIRYLLMKQGNTRLIL